MSNLKTQSVSIENQPAVDEVRQHLSSELGFCKEHRDLNIQRLSYVAKEITRHDGIAIIAAIAPYAAVRQQVRDMIMPAGGFIEVYLSTPITTCKARDVKGLYAKARLGKLPHFTGIDDPYETPENPALGIDTTKQRLSVSLNTIVQHLQSLGYLALKSTTAILAFEEKQEIAHV